MEIEFQVIGHIKSSYQEKFGTPRNSGLAPSSRGVIELNSKLIKPESLQGLETFSHIWIIYAFHLNDNKKNLVKVHPPKLEGEKMGVFATRSPHHHNPIGLSVVKLSKVEGLNIFIENLDIVEGTPVLDIKPYVAKYDSISETTSGWVPEISEPVINFHSVVQNLLSSLPEGERIKNLITETLRQDPRPTSYKKKSQEDQNYWMTLENLNIQFEWRDGGFQILALEKLSRP